MRGLAACLVALAVVFAIASKTSLANLIPLQDPVILEAKAQGLLRELGYRDAPVDSVSGTRYSEFYTPASSVSDPGGAVPLDASYLSGPIIFTYRQSSLTLLDVNAIKRGCVVVLASIRIGGLLALLVQLSVWSILTAAPLTFDVGRWYVWRSWFVVALVIGLALWGFRNVLGKQSAFPAGALDG